MSLRISVLGLALAAGLASPPGAAAAEVDLHMAAIIQATAGFATVGCSRAIVAPRLAEVLRSFGATERDVALPPWTDVTYRTELELTQADDGCARADALLGPSGRFPGVLVPGRDNTRWGR